MDIGTRIVEGVIVIDISGEMFSSEADSDALKHMIQGLLDMGQKQIVVNIEKCSRFNTLGLGAIVDGKAMVLKANAAISLVSRQERVKALLQMTHIGDVVDVHDTEQSAVSSMRKAS